MQVLERYLQRVLKHPLLWARLALFVDLADHVSPPRAPPAPPTRAAELPRVIQALFPAMTGARAPACVSVCVCVFLCVCVC